MTQISKSIILLVAGLALATSLAGCAETFGYGKNAPDEFNVVKKPPLILPPDYRLRPPQAGVTRGVTSGRDLAKLLILGPQNNAPPDPAEQDLLNKAADGGNYGDGVREIIHNEAQGTISQPHDKVDTLVEDATLPTQ
ncbi:MAG: DUF3035 domain-containing protein [Parvibaculales bacterium]